MSGVEVGFICYMNRYITNGPNGIQHDTVSCCQFNSIWKIK